jgi:DNA (cytosine-5)-methyltransferase 1
MDLTHFSLFSGIGGIDLASEWAGFRTVGQCEFADYPTKVLEKHWPDVPRWRDVRDVTAESVRDRGIREITLISGGFPCQPFSVAGKQKGKGDDRYLWPEMLRVIRELAPRWVVGENVPGILRIAADDVCKDLEREGYEVGIFDFEAASVGAKHRRERIFFVGYSKYHGLPTPTFSRSYIENAGTSKKRQEQTVKFKGTSEPGSNENVAHAESQQDRGLQFKQLQPNFGTSGKNVADTYNKRLQIARQKPGIKEVPTENGTQFSGWWSIEPDVGRVAHGVPSRVDRLKCLGNAVVPQQVYPILKAIAEIERMG